MRRSSLVSLIVSLIALGFYFLVIDPMFVDNRWAAFIASILIAASCNLLHRKLEGRFAYLDKRIDMQLSVWIVFGLLIIFPLLVGALA